MTREHLYGRAHEAPALDRVADRAEAPGAHASASPSVDAPPPEASPAAAPAGNPRKRRSRRTRMISFRVSDREFEALQSQSEAEGARSISDYARMALCGICHGPGDRMDQGILQLSDEIQQLSADVRHMASLLETPRRTVIGRMPAGPARKDRE